MSATPAVSAAPSTSGVQHFSGPLARESCGQHAAGACRFRRLSHDPPMPLAEPPYLKGRQPWRDLRSRGPFHRGTVYNIKDISADLKSDPERQLLLFCGPDEGGWRLGV